MASYQAGRCGSSGMHICSQTGKHPGCTHVRKSCVDDLCLLQPLGAYLGYIKINDRQKASLRLPRHHVSPAHHPLRSPTNPRGAHPGLDLRRPRRIVLHWHQLPIALEHRLELRRHNFRVHLGCCPPERPHARAKRTSAVVLTSTVASAYHVVGPNRSRIRPFLGLAPEKDGISKVRDFER